MSNRDIVFWTVITFAGMGLYCVITTTLTLIFVLGVRRQQLRGFPVTKEQHNGQRN